MYSKKELDSKKGVQAILHRVISISLNNFDQYNSE